MSDAVVVENDNDIRRQVPGIVDPQDKKVSELKDQELFYRAIGR
jgi:hypothetical protein